MFLIFHKKQQHSGTQLCGDGKGFCRNGQCDLTADGIDTGKVNNNRANWCTYSNFKMCDYSASTCGNDKLELGEDCDGGSCCTNECKIKATAHCNYETYSFDANGVKVTTKNECCTEYCKPR